MGMFSPLFSNARMHCHSLLALRTNRRRRAKEQVKNI
jgi:hypothetical protein